MADVLTARAPAKVNLVLEVLGRRGDGYHELDTILQTLELADSVELDFRRPAGVSVQGPFAAGTPADESNLAFRAAKQLAARLGQADLPHITLEKRIPAAGGLGGGASDAATVLRLLQRRWRGATDELLLDVAAEVGSDEPALVLGGTVRARGRGERVTALPDLPPHGVVLFVPPFTIERKTAAMFAALSSHAFDDGRVAERFACSPLAPFAATDVYNAFERVAYDVFPQLAALAADLEERTGEPVRLAGAGPVLFWLGPPAGAPRIATAAFGADCTVISTATAGSLWAR